MVEILFYFLFVFLLNIKSINSKDTNIDNDYNNIVLSIINKNDTIIKLIDMIKGNPDIIKSNKQLVNNTIKDFIEENNISFIYTMLDGLYFNETSKFSDDLLNALKNNIDGTNALDYILNIINYVDGNNNINMSRVFYEIHKFLICPGMDKVFNYFEEYEKITFKLFEAFIIKTKFADFYLSLVPYSYVNYIGVVQKLAYDLLIAYNDTEKMVDISINFVEEQKYEFMLYFRVYIDYPQMEEMSKLIHFKDKVMEALKEAFFRDYLTFSILIQMFYFRETLEIIIKSVKDGIDEYYFSKILPDLIDTLINLEDGIYYDILINNLNKLVENIKKVTNLDDYVQLITVDLMKYAEEFFLEEGFYTKNFTTNCNYLMKEVFFSQRTNLTAFYLKKILIDSTKNKNDFLTYENCLVNKQNIPGTENLNFTVKPVFIIGMIDDYYYKPKLKNSSLNEKFNFLSSFCFPYGTYHNGIEMCSNDEYIHLTKAALQFFYNMSTTNITVIKILDDKLKVDYAYFSLSLILLFFPLIIKLFLYLYKTIKMKKNKGQIQMIKPQGNKGSISNIKLFEKKFNPPNWYKYTFIFFNIIRNIKELFNFESNLTNFNNLNGITYIKGILGISMILYVFGHIFLILINLPSKGVTQSGFFKTIFNPISPLIVLTLRYCPRIIFSCSGYIFVFKYLSFIEQEQRNYFFKFIFLQSYKFVLLFFVLIFMRFFLYYLDILFTKNISPIKQIYKYNIENDNYFFSKFFSFLLVNTGTIAFNNRQNLVQYFYLPINEMFLFLFGVIFVSFGYKCKIKLDYIIIFLLIVLYSAKIVFYTIDLHDRQIFSTLYFYLYDYGELMLNPMFNLPYYLIGMYFGLINFSIQKGISLNKSEKLDSYSAIELLEQCNEEKEDIKEEEACSNDFLGINDESVEIDTSQGRISSDSSSKISALRVQRLSKDIIFNNSFKTRKASNKNNRSYKRKNLEEEEENNKNKSVKVEELDEKLREMPFLIAPLKFLNFHRRIYRRYILRLIYLLGFAFIIFSMCIHFLFEPENNDQNYSLEKYISDLFLNIYYTIDIELVVIIINWIFFTFYSKSQKSADIFDFLNSVYWSFFVKSYFSFTVISTPIIIFIFYQSETVIQLSVGNVFLYFSIDIIFILLGDILFYSFFEFPFKKIFKAFFIREEIINIENEGTKEDELNPIDIEEDQALMDNMK